MSCSHKPGCAHAMLRRRYVRCESVHGCQKNLNCWSAAHCLHVYVIYKQTLNMESVHCVSTSDKYLAGCGQDEQRNTSCEMPAFVFNIRFHDNPRDGVFFLFTYMPHLNHHSSLPFLKVFLKKLHLLLKMSFGCLTTGLHSVSCFSVVCPCQFAFVNCMHYTCFTT